MSFESHGDPLTLDACVKKYKFYLKLKNINDIS